MTSLNPAALATLRAAGITSTQWTQQHGHGETWFGDACGCPDDRCIGYHHHRADDCGCLPALLEQALLEADIDVMTTPEVAEYLGISSRSVRTTTARMGIKPTGRGLNGNLYPRTAITARRPGARTDLAASNPVHADLADRLRAALRRNRMTQTELARVTHRSEKHISQILNGTAGATTRTWSALITAASQGDPQ